MKRISRCDSIVGIAIGILLLSANPLRADVARSAGTTDIVGEGGELVVENSIGFEADNDGSNWTLDAAVLYSSEFLPKFSLLLEPTLWEWDRPKDEAAVDGFGDTDLSLFYQLISEGEMAPGMVIGTKVKLPTADNRDIGTGKADYSALVIVGKEYGELNVNLELEYATFGQPAADPVSPDKFEPLAEEEAETESDPALESFENDLASAPSDKLKNQFIYTITIDYGLTDNLTACMELFGNTEPTEDESSAFAAGIGLEYDIELSDSVALVAETGIDTDSLVKGKVGIEWSF